MECKEESGLESYFLLLANFSHDRAKEVVAQEPSLPAATLGNLAMAEKQYLALTFLQPRTSVFQVRKEPALRAVYQGLCSELEAVGRGGAAWAEEAAALVRLRVGMIEVYERLSGGSGHLPPPYAEVTQSLSSLLEGREGGEEQPLAPWRAVLGYETGCLQSLLSAGLAMQAWHFFPSLMLLTRGCELLSQWEEVVALRETRKMSFASSLLRGVTGWVEPHLYLWLHRLKAAMLSKFSLYFYTCLARQAPALDMARLCTKLTTDQPARLLAFQKRVDAQAVLIVYAGLEQGDCGRPGYRHLSGEAGSTPLPTGLDCFPVVFSCPALQDSQFPGLVMILTDRTIDLAADRTFYFYDAGLPATYFIHSVEPRFYMVTICEGRRGEKDSAINTFIQETVGHLRCTRLCNSLKPGYK